MPAYSRDELDHLLAQLDDCDLSDWDRDFVEKFQKMILAGPLAWRAPTARQAEQFDRMKEQYL